MEPAGPPSTTPRSAAFQALVLGTLFAILVGWVLYIARDILIPIAFSVMVVYVIIGTDRLLARIPGVGRALPSAARLGLASLVMIAALGLVAWLIMGNLDQMVARATHYQSSLLSLVRRYSMLMGVESEPTWESIRDQVLARVSPQRLVALMVLSLTSILASLTVAALYVVFLIIERRHFDGKIGRLSRDPERVAQVRRIITDVNSRIGTYLALKTAVNVLLGTVSWLVLAWFGVEFAVFWALLIGLLNYVPYVGSVLGVAIPAVFGLLQFGDLGVVIGLALALSVVQFLTGNILDPLLMGSSLNLSPFVILACLATWSALWGIPGAFLAVPITACIVMILAEFDGTRPIAVLLSRDGSV
jgi:predicted PurR-regulated permease PerM